ncbi:MAG TPA: NAD(P)-dependent oxidoreductase [Verrucomicrobiae bacterium]|nr:NAD(P)-dependent oxidoreductase [Verrucomicrobiae bacterium]
MNHHSDANARPEAVAGLEDTILVTGAAGFIGQRVVASLLERGFRNVRCLARRPGARLPGSDDGNGGQPAVQMIHGNLLSPEDCKQAVQNVKVIYHLAAGSGEKSFADAYLNSVVTTRNLVVASLADGSLRRFVNISSFAVYSNRNKPTGDILDESCPIKLRSERNGDAYTYAKIKQDELIMDYGAKQRLPYVVLRPGAVYGPGKRAITGRVGISTFGIYLHLGGFNQIPFSYVDNCADAIVLAGLKPGIDGQIFNVVDDDLPCSFDFLRSFKRQVKPFRSLYMPRFASYLLCHLWEKYADFSQGQLPPVFNRARWHAEWKGSGYSNEKLKEKLGWRQNISTREGMERYFADCRAGGGLHA